MSWVRLYLTVEGHAELRFAKDTLCDHLAQFEVELRPRMILTSRKLGVRGGGLNFQRFKRDTSALMRDDDHREARFSTMIDLFALPADYPGWKDARLQTTSSEQVLELEKALFRDFGDSRFIPYLQLHEFEALLYCDLAQVRSRIEGSEKAIAALQKEVAAFNCPEDINDGETTAPSKRLINHVPRYQKLKVRVGAPAAAAIGLQTLRQKCPHFGGWLSRLENLAKQL